MGSCFSREKSVTVTEQELKEIPKVSENIATQSQTLSSDDINPQLKSNLEETDLDKLRKNSFSTLKDFTYDGKILLAKVTSCYDGDSCVVVFYDAGRPVKYHFRMHSYDSPEIKPRKNIPNRELHMKAARISRDLLIRMLEKNDNIVWLCFTKEEKFGRLMGQMFLFDEKTKEFSEDNINVNQWMIDNGLGKSYLGKAKEEFTLEELQKIIKISDIEI